MPKNTTGGGTILGPSGGGLTKGFTASSKGKQPSKPGVKPTGSGPGSSKKTAAGKKPFRRSKF